MVMIGRERSAPSFRNACAAAPRRRETVRREIWSITSSRSPTSMTIAPAAAPAARPLRTPAAAPKTQPPIPDADVARVDVFASLAEARRDWAELEAVSPASPYQTFAFADGWCSTIGAARHASPFIVVARDAGGAPLALLPLARRSRGPFGVVEFIGGKHANFNLGLFRPGRAWSAAALAGLLGAAAGRAETRIDLYAFLNQPRDWQGRVNPLSALGGRPSPSFGCKSELPLDFEAWRNARYSRAARKKLRQKAERLATMGAVSHGIARDEAEAGRTLDALIAQRRERARAAGSSRRVRKPGSASLSAPIVDASDRRGRGRSWSSMRSCSTGASLRHSPPSEAAIA